MKYDLKQSKSFSSFDSIDLRFGNTGTALRNIAKPGRKKKKSLALSFWLAQSIQIEKRWMISFDQ